ncbi:type II toxin-antitoxin system VapC family toxin [Raineyella sp. LH-20]|uniref:type II toxin-antitoxin system VapC family toxin n=1 Tax=Raineyella sp. LH-20 TaxID=3081204 RepID=UPI002954EBF1|nr:type II toxin-antitoxin system VapC family toxin [Raineyella sp. LH-20]WOP17727.1 type II toxin-antitoxin system VapC family toxin [Raineyella sp. LH-20]
MIVVLDASAAVHVVLNGPKAGLITPALSSADAVIAPDLLSAEVGNALWKYVRAGQLDLDRALTGLADALDLVTDLLPLSTLGAEALSESVRLDHPVYDLLYVVATRRAAATLLTVDRRLGDLARRVGVRVIGTSG